MSTFNGETTLHNAQEYAIVHLPGGSYVAVYGDGTTGRGVSASLKSRPGHSEAAAENSAPAWHCCATDNHHDKEP